MLTEVALELLKRETFLDVNSPLFGSRPAIAIKRLRGVQHLTAGKTREGLHCWLERTANEQAAITA